MKDLVREIEALPSMWSDVARKGGYTVKELLEVAEHNQHIKV